MIVQSPALHNHCPHLIDFAGPFCLSANRTFVEQLVAQECDCPADKCSYVHYLKRQHRAHEHGVNLFLFGNSKRPSVNDSKPCFKPLQLKTGSDTGRQRMVSKRQPVRGGKESMAGQRRRDRLGTGQSRQVATLDRDIAINRYAGSVPVLLRLRPNTWPIFIPVNMNHTWIAANRTILNITL